MIGEPPPGAVIDCSYLPARPAASGEAEPLAERPAVVLAAHRREEPGETEILVLPVTRTPPKRPWEAVAIPFAAREEVGLDPGPAWIVTIEANVLLGQGAAPEPAQDGPATPVRGRIPPALLRRVARSFLDNRASQRSLPPPEHDP